MNARHFTVAGMNASFLAVAAAGQGYSKTVGVAATVNATLTAKCMTKCIPHIPATMTTGASDFIFKSASRAVFW